MKKKISIAAGVALSAFFIWIIARQVDFARVVAIYGQVRFWHLLVLMLGVVADLLVRGFRWSLLIRPAKRVSGWTVIKLEGMGIALNNVLPLRLGEVARASIGAGILGVPIMTLLSTILVERVLDTMTLAVMFVISARFGAGMAAIGTYRHAVWAMLAVMAAGLACLVFLDELLVHSKAFAALLDRFPRVGKFARQLAMGAEALRDFRLAVSIIALGFLLWSIDAFGFGWGGRCLSLDPLLGAGRSMFVLCVAALSVVLPAVPGYFGAYEYAVQQVLVSWGYDKDLALAYATFVHINTYLVMTVIGLAFLYQAGGSLGKVWRSFGGEKRPEEPIRASAER